MTHPCGLQAFCWHGVSKIGFLDVPGLLDLTKKIKSSDLKISLNQNFLQYVFHANVTHRSERPLLK